MKSVELKNVGHCPIWLVILRSFHPDASADQISSVLCMSSHKIFSKNIRVIESKQFSILKFT